MLPALLAVGVAYLLALGAGRLCARIGVPRVTGILLVGIAAGPSAAALSGLPPVLDEATLGSLEPISDLALALIIFAVGGCFRLESVRRGGRSLLWTSTAEIATTALLVGGATLAAGAAPEVALLLAVMAVTTAPAATRMVAREYESEGALSDQLMVLIGIDNIVAIVAFVLILQAMAMPSSAMVGTAVSLGGPLIVGGVAGVVLVVMDQRLAGREQRQILVLAVMAAAVGCCEALGLPPLLASLVAGAVHANTSPRPQLLLEDVKAFDYPLHVVFFLTAGAHLRLELLPEIGVVGVVYVLARTIGKVGGCSAGAAASRAPVAIRRWLGPAMLAQAGLAIGLSGTLASSVPRVGVEVETVVLAAVVIFECVGPLLTRLALVRSGEVTLMSLYSRRPAVSYAEGLHHVAEHFRDALGIPSHHRVDDASDIFVAHLMRRSVDGVRQDLPFEDVLHAFGHSRYDRLPVLDREEHLVGVIRYADVSGVLFDGALRGLVVAGDMAGEAGVLLRPEDTLEVALQALRSHPDQTTLIVVDSFESRRPVGALRHNDVLSAYRTRGEAPPLGGKNDAPLEEPSTVETRPPMHIVNRGGAP